MMMNGNYDCACCMLVLNELQLPLLPSIQLNFCTITF